MSSIYDFSKNLKSKSPSERTVSPSIPIPKHERRVLAWTVSWVLSVGKQKSSKTNAKLKTSFLMTTKISTDSGKTFVLYRTQMLIRLLAFPKPAFDQLAIELPCLMGFRASEVASWMAEYIDFQNMDTSVYDTKKKCLFTVPLNLYVAEHAEEILNGRAEGHVLRSRSNRNLGEQLTPFAIWHIWNKYTTRLPNGKDISPVTGRRFFAAEWYYKQGLSLVTLQMILRHTHFETTMRYVRSLVFYEDMKANYDKFQGSMAKSLEKMQLQMQVPESAVDASRSSQTLSSRSLEASRLQEKHKETKHS